MSSPELNPVSFVVLGLIARDGPSTAYDLKTAVARGIAYFWPFPHSQIYSETERLARLGFLTHEREENGRRRRVYRITRTGQSALRAWLAVPTGDVPQFRSLALLKLFFGQFAAPEDIAALAAAQLQVLREAFEKNDQMFERLRARGDRPWQMASGKLLNDALRAMVPHWRHLERPAAHRPPSREARARRQRTVPR